VVHRVIVWVLALAGCAFHADTTAEATAPVARSVQDHCASPPVTGGGKFRHTSTRAFAKLGDPRHRGTDLIAVETDQFQTIAGKLAYTAADKDAKDEDVELFACIDADWKSLGTTRTDRGGRFTLSLSGDQRLPPGLRDLYGFVPGDRSGFRFLSYVARTGDSVIVADIDGTLTASEKAVFNTVLFGEDIGHRANAPQTLAGSGRVVIYLSSRGDQLTGLTRTWLREHGFPVGPIRHAPSLVVKPGAKTIAFKATELRALPMPIHAAIGNRATDVAAYHAAGIPADRIFVKLPEFESELAHDLGTKRAIGFTDYGSLIARLR
jgi:phosphatidate phosphatase PAH1